MKDDMTLEEVEQMVIRTELAKCRAKELVERHEKPREVNSVRYRLGNQAKWSEISRNGRQSYRNYGRPVRSRSRSSSRDRDRGQFNNNRYDYHRRNRNLNEHQQEGNFSGRFGNREGNNHHNVICNFCKLRGHVKRNCFKLKNRRTVNFMDEAPVEINSYDFKRLQIRDSDNNDDDYPCMMIASNRFSKPCIVGALVEGILLDMEIDCGAGVTVISLATYRAYFNRMKTFKCNSRLVVVNGQQLSIFGEISVNVVANYIQQQVTLVILDCVKSFVPLFGRNWLDIFYPNWRNTFGNSIMINTMSKDGHYNSEKIHDMGNIESDIKSRFPKVFDGDFSYPKTGLEADLVLKEDRPIFRKAYNVPFKLREKVVDHLDSLEKQNVISPLQVQL
ncbi:uncharacterized protein LOC134219689 [Armigeres subalbatus]|uniref:uncharacterized protein LOC134219689 n=1 Tax=Armigeres subalbatus TaxID=124917 RepID=UPI002ED1A475